MDSFEGFEVRIVPLGSSDSSYQASVLAVVEGPASTVLGLTLLQGVILNLGSRPSTEEVAEKASGRELGTGWRTQELQIVSWRRTDFGSELGCSGPRFQARSASGFPSGLGEPLIVICFWSSFRSLISTWTSKHHSSRFEHSY